ncbi:MAG TPA: histidine--tRNA ligase [Patescibacteria group bacterium]|jgi:histidyl-tRNA synthetase|nr:histidine--tRNA ligase [Patescibacteria group bacterium]
MSNESQKSERIEPRLLKGFRDYGPIEQLARQQMFSKIQSVFERFGFLPLSTPVLEYKDILIGKIGEDEKLIYSFKDNGDRDVAMRYDLTVPLARYVAQNQGQLTFPFKRYQIAPVWRADNPQKGRLREFYQCDVDAVGTDSPVADAEVIACLCLALEAVGAKNYKVRLNDRATFEGLSQESIRAMDKLDKIGVDGVVAEMKEKNVSDSEIKTVQQTITGKARIIPKNLADIIELIASNGIDASKIGFDPTIARGLDYYTGTVFEIYLDDAKEFGSICSGGRYDGLVDKFSTQSLPAVGGSIGVDRLIQALTEMGVMENAQPIRALILNQNEELLNNYLKLAADLRAGGVNVEFFYSDAKLDKQFKYAESKGIPYAIIMGEAEVKDGTVQLKDLAKREQETVSVADLTTKLQ